MRRKAFYRRGHLPNKSVNAPGFLLGFQNYDGVPQAIFEHAESGILECVDIDKITMTDQQEINKKQDDNE